MSKKSNLVAALVALALLGVIGFGLVWVVGWARSLNPTVAGAVTTAGIGLVGLWYVQWQSKSRDIAESHRPSKIEIYNTFFGIVERLQANDGEAAAEGELPEWMKAEFIKLNRGLILWAAPEVIRAWLEFRTCSESGGNILVAADKMYQAIRKDLGNSNFGLQTGDLIKISLSNPNEWRP